MAVLPQVTTATSAANHVAHHNALHPKYDVTNDVLTGGTYQYTIRQATLGGSVPARPSTALVPNGGVTWHLFNEPGPGPGPNDVQSLDLVINISGTPW
jgi:hypothetical protein